MSDGANRALRQVSASVESALKAPEQKSRSWEKFSQWVSCVCVVTFDLELGQAIEVNILAACCQGSWSVYHSILAAAIHYMSIWGSLNLA